MRPVIVLLLLATAMLALAYNPNPDAILKWEQLPACARSCTVLTTSEAICIPPAAPVAPSLIYTDCLCKSAMIDILPLCTDVCNYTEAWDITDQYAELCSVPLPGHSPKPKPLPPTPTIDPPPKTKTAESVPNGHTETPSDPPLPTITSAAAQPSEDWKHKNWKYMAIAGVLILVTFLVIFGLAFYYRRRKHFGRRKQQNNSIPLQILRQPRPKSGESTVPLNHASSASTLRPPPSAAETFPAHLRLYAQELREQEERRMKRASASEAVQPAAGV